MGEVRVPETMSACSKLLERVNVRVRSAANRFRELAESRTADERVRQQLTAALERWFIVGREAPKPGALPSILGAGGGDSDSGLDLAPA
jgi:hypothetical protein